MVLGVLDAEIGVALCLRTSQTCLLYKRLTKMDGRIIDATPRSRRALSGDLNG